MKAIINGRRYNTEAPRTECLGEDWGEGLGRNDFHYYFERLYRTGKGKYFLAGEGGPMTKYAVRTGNGQERRGGERIIPLTPEEAREWLERLTCLYNDERALSAIEKYFILKEA